MSRRAKPFDRPVDGLLMAFREAGYGHTIVAPNTWRLPCPACEGSLYARQTLRLVEHGDPGAPVSLRCSNGCSEANIVAAVGLKVRTLDHWIADLVRVALADRAHLIAEVKRLQALLRSLLPLKAAA